MMSIYQRNNLKRLFAYFLDHPLPKEMQGVRITHDSTSVIFEGILFTVQSDARFYFSCKMDRHNIHGHLPINADLEIDIPKIIMFYR